MASWTDSPKPDDEPPPGSGEPYDNRTVDDGRCHCGRPYVMFNGQLQCPVHGTLSEIAATTRRKDA